MGAFFINSSEILTLAMLNNKAFYFNQKEMANAIGCRQPNISYVINNLIEKGIVENAKGFIMVNQYRLVDCLVAYAEAVYNSNVYFQENVLKLRNWDPEIYAFFETYSIDGFWAAFCSCFDYYRFFISISYSCL